MKNIDLIFSRYRKSQPSPPKPKKRSLDDRQQYKSTSRRAPNIPDIYVKNIITSPNIVNIHTTTIRLDSKHTLSRHFPVTDKYKQSKRFDFMKQQSIGRGLKASPSIDPDPLSNFEENFRLQNGQRRKRYQFRLAKENKQRRTKTLEHQREYEVDAEDFKRRHKTITRDQSDKSIRIINQTISRELQTLDIDFSVQVLNWDEVELPLTPKEVLNKYEKYLTVYERKEILDYDSIYFIGHKAHKIEGRRQSADEVSFDNKTHDYKYVINDHIAYRYELLETIGKGAFGQVIKVFDHKRKSYGALKIIKNKDNFSKQALVELKILRYIKEKDVRGQANIVRVKDFVTFRGHVCIVFELLDISLYDFMKKNQFQGFTYDLIRKLTVQILQSLTFMQAHKIVHCDLKPQNIVLKQPGKSGIRLIDFGTSCFQNQKVYTYIQSRFYRSPQIVLGVSYTTKIDMWSFGCIVGELFTGYPLFPAESEDQHLYMMVMTIGVPAQTYLQKCGRAKAFFTPDGQLKKNIKPKKARQQSKMLRQILQSEDQNFIDFVQRCLKWDPQQRISPKDALIHPFIVNGLPEDIKREHLKQMSSKNPYNLLPET